MRAPSLCLAALTAACSLDGLASGGSGGGGGAATASTTSGTSSSSSGVGGQGGDAPASPFSWALRFGNDLTQGTSPYATDAGSGSTLRVSERAADGRVWVAATTRGAIDFDGDGGGDALGAPADVNLFLLEIDGAGAIATAVALEGSFRDVADVLSVGAVVRGPADEVLVAGTIKGGTLDLGAAGEITQTSLSTDDAFVLRFDGAGAVTHARQIGGSSTQSARSAVLGPDGLHVGGRLRRFLTVADPSGAVDPACDVSAGAEDFDRSFVLRLDPGTLVCDAIATFTASETGAAQQAHALAVDETGVYVGGSFSRQIIPEMGLTVPSSSSDDGYVIALEPDLGTPTVRWVATLTSNRSGASDGVRALALSGGSLWVGGHQDRGTSAVMGLEPALGTADMVPGDDCSLPLADARDGVVGRLDPMTGACLGAVALGAAFQDEVRSLGAFPDGRVVAVGFTTSGVPELSSELAGGSRDAFVAILTATAGVSVESGMMLGGASWDYLDGGRAGSTSVVVAGTYDLPFAGLGGGADFFVGELSR